MLRPRFGLHRRLRGAHDVASGTTQKLSNGLSALVRRAQQWVASRERLVASWLRHFSTQPRSKFPASRRDAAGALRLPFWWEYESELKCRLALEAVLRRLFSLVPEPMSPA